MPPSGRTYVTFPYYYETFVVYLSYCAPSHLPQMSFIYVFCEGHFSLLYFHLTLIDVDTVLFHCIRSPYKGGSHKTCSCPSVRYFRMLFRDVITVFWDENLRKQTSYWSKTFFFSVCQFEKRIVDSDSQIKKTI